MALPVREKHPVSFLILDIDHFKYYNDSLGHPAGDELPAGKMGKILTGLGQAATRMSSSSLGGEEFGVLLPET